MDFFRSKTKSDDSNVLFEPRIAEAPGGAKKFSKIDQVNTDIFALKI